MCSKVFTTTYVCIHAHPHPDTSEIKCPSSLKENKQKKPPQSLTSFIKGILSPARFHKHFHSILPSTHSFHSYKHRYLCKWDHHVCHSLCHRIRRNHPKCTIPGVNRYTFHSGRNLKSQKLLHTVKEYWHIQARNNNPSHTCAHIRTCACAQNCCLRGRCTKENNQAKSL